MGLRVAKLTRADLVKFESEDVSFVAFHLALKGVDLNKATPAILADVLDKFQAMRTKTVVSPRSFGIFGEELATSVAQTQPYSTTAPLPLRR